jgi:hypothetical protein
MRGERKDACEGEIQRGDSLPTILYQKEAKRRDPRQWTLLEDSDSGVGGRRELGLWLALWELWKARRVFTLDWFVPDVTATGTLEHADIPCHVTIQPVGARVSFSGREAGASYGF